MLTKSALIKMQQVEEKFFTNTIYQNGFCLMSENLTGCVKPTSVLRYFDGSYLHLDPIFHDPEYDNISQVLHKADQYPETKRTLRGLLGVGATITMARAVANITRIGILLGLPLPGYSNDLDRASEQQSKLKKFVAKTLSPLGDDYFEAGVGDMSFCYGNSITVNRSIGLTVLRDFRFLGGGYVFVVAFLWWQTNSLWLVSFVMLSTVTGFCGANLIYRVLFNYRYFGVFHVLSIFIMLGISADDVFVFNDAWRLTAFMPNPTLSNRLSACYRRVAPAMFFTSLTTTVAFSVSAMSDLFTVSSFGIFSALIVVVNYVSIITFLPCAIIFHHVHLRRFACCCCCPKPDFDDEAKPDLNVMVGFFGGPYFRFITHRIARCVILAVFAVGLMTSTYFASMIQINDEPVIRLTTH